MDHRVYISLCNEVLMTICVLLCFLIVCQVLDHLCFLGKLRDKGYSSDEAAAALLLFDNSVAKVCFNSIC